MSDIFQDGVDPNYKNYQSGKEPRFLRKLTPVDRQKANALAEYIYDATLEARAGLELTDYEFKHDLINIIKWISFVVKFAMLIPIGNATLRSGVSLGAGQISIWAKDYLKKAGR